MKNSSKYFLYGLLVFLFCFASNFAFAQTDIYGGVISVNTIWTKGESPYVIYAPVEGDTVFTVNSSTTLTIESGTIIKFDYGQSINISGKLIVNGTGDEKVYFTSLYNDSIGGDTDLDEGLIEPYNNDWVGIEIVAGGNVELNNSVISYAETGIYSDSATASLDNIDIINCQDGISVSESFVDIKNSKIKDLTGDGINIVNDSILNIEDSSMENISGSFLFLYSNSTSSIKSTTINNVGFDGFGIYYDSVLEFEDSSFKNITGQLLYMFGNSSVEIKNSIIENLSNGIVFFQNSILNISDSQIKNVVGYPFLEFYQGSHLNFVNSSLEDITGTSIGCYGSIWDGYSTTTLNISGSTVSDGDDIGLQLSGDKLEVNITKTKIQNFAGDGIQTYSYPFILVTDSEISNNNNGIISWGSNIEIKNSIISNNQIYGVSNNPAITGTPEIIAINNWWGDASGPYNSTINASGTANKVSGNVAIQPWLNLKPGEKQKCCSNVLFIPGLEASRLYKTDSDGNEVRVWEPGLFHDNSEIFLNVEGKSIRSDIYTKDVIDNAYLPIKGNIYSSFISSMNEMKTNGLINDWKSVPYDWRLSLNDLLNGGKEYPDGKIYYAGELGSTSNPYILSELRRLASSSATGKVIIIAHSNGGLITKELTNKLGAEAPLLIEQIIFVAVPQAGTPTAIGALLHGFQQGLPKDWLPIFISSSESRELGKNMSSAYNLLPFSQYFNYVSDPVITFDNSDLLSSWRAKYGNVINSGEGLYNFLSDQSREILPTKSELVSLPLLNINLLDSSKELHDAKLDSWTLPAEISLTEIAGWGEDTLSGIEYYQGIKTECTNYNIFSTCSINSQTPVLEYRPKITYDGDGTVVVPSALWTTSSTSVEKYWVNLDDYNVFLIRNSAHANILEVPELRSFIESIIMQSFIVLPEYISTLAPIIDDLEKRLRFILHSPLSLDLYDEQGNHTGISTSTNELEENIPNSHYITFGEVKYVSVPASSTIFLSMQGYSSGSFTLDIEEVQGNIVIASTTFAGVPSSTSTIATMNIPSGNILDISPLFVDINGDGSQDITLSPKINDVVVPDFSKKQSSPARRHRASLVINTISSSTNNFNDATTSVFVFTSGTKPVRMDAHLNESFGQVHPGGQSSNNNGGSTSRSDFSQIKVDLTGQTGKGESSVFIKSTATTTSTSVFASVTKQSRFKNIKNESLLSRSEAGRGESSVFTKSQVNNQSLLASVGDIQVGNNLVRHVISITIIFIKNIINKISLWYNYWNINLI